MRITIFTSNQPRHLHLAKVLAETCDECHVVTEGNTVFPGVFNDFYKKSNVMERYFKNVMAAEKSIFGDIGFIGGNIKTLSIKSGDLNLVSRDILAPALEADYYIVFGASYIKGWLIDELVKRRAVNIHMGVSPYYRGASCNFWALYDENPHLVGATIHMLSKGLDSGDMLCHALPDMKTVAEMDPFAFTMQSVKSAHMAVRNMIDDGSLLDITPVKQDRAGEVRYARYTDFNDKVAQEFLDRAMTMGDLQSMLERKHDASLYLNPVYA